jgi:hypothetical protein
MLYVYKAGNGTTVGEAYRFNDSANSFDDSKKLSSCLSIFNKLSEDILTFDPINGSPIQKTKNDIYKWVIQTKFETPLLNFSGSSTQTIEDLQSSSSVYISSSLGESERVGNYADIKLVKNKISGVWDKLGTVPDDLQSIQISLERDPFLEQGAVEVGLASSSQSLIDLCGFREETKSIGVLAEAKEISEAVVLLPFIKNLSRPNSLSDIVIKNEIEKAFLFQIDRKKINKLLKVADYRNLRIDEIKIILEKNLDVDKNNSIIDLMIKMVNYNIPPHLNWLYNKDITPFVMYIAEFNHVLDKQELADIWQGTMPEIAKTPEEQNVVLEHFLGENELFGGVDITKYNPKMKVFKIKKRAKNNYFDLTADVEDNKRYDFGKGEGVVPWYSYNWPYDYFSLVELVNIQAGEVQDLENLPPNGSL